MMGPSCEDSHPVPIDLPSAARSIDLSPAIADEVKTTTCYMCACRCGIKVHLKDGRIRYIEGNRDHPVNRGVLCAKGSAGIMTQISPARLRKPLKRVGERGKGEFVEIEWDDGTRRSPLPRNGSRRSAGATRASSPSSPGATRVRR
jgi:hypothetical protein